MARQAEAQSIWFPLGRIVSCLVRCQDFPGRLRLVGWLRRLGSGRRIVVGGLKGERFAVDPGDYVQRTIMYTGAYEPEVATALLDALEPGERLLDIGANVGAASIGAALRGHEVDAFEADPLTAGVCRLNLSLSAVSEDRYRLHEFALSDHPGMAEFFRTGLENVGRSGLNSVGDAAESFQVPVETLDGLIASGRLHPAQVWKLDVEGSEAAVLRGAENLLRTSPPHTILFEDAAHCVEDSEVARQLMPFGYSVKRLQRPGGLIEDRENFVASRQEPSGRSN